MTAWLANVDFAWMAWTWPVAVFFIAIAIALLTMTALAIWRPETPRRGILRISTTRGDRLFISLVASAYICIAWIAISTGLGHADVDLWGALGLSVVNAVAVFRYV